MTGWGVLGTGFAAVHFAQGLAAVPGARLAAVASRSPSRAEAYARRFKVLRCHPDLTALTADSDVDIVYVASENHRHRDDCLAVLAAGKAVLCEKPVATTLDEARQITDAARNAGRFCMEALRVPFLPAVRRARQLIDEGAIGTPVRLHAALGHRALAGKRVFDPAQGGGALLDLGVYPLSLALCLLGRPQSVCSRRVLSASGVDSGFDAVLEYGGRGLATVGADLTAALPEGAWISGTEGRIRLEGPIYALNRLSVERYNTARADDQDPLYSQTATGRMDSASRARARLGSVRHWVRALRAYRRMRHESLPQLGNGFSGPAAEAQRCLQAGLQESPLHSLDQALALMHCVEQVRRAWD